MLNNLLAQLVAIRRAAKLTQADIAQKSGLARVTLSKIETGAADPQLSTVEEYARSLDLDLVLVPKALRIELEVFIRSGGKALAQPPGASAPKSIVQQLADGY